MNGRAFAATGLLILAAGAAVVLVRCRESDRGAVPFGSVGAAPGTSADVPIASGSSGRASATSSPDGRVPARVEPAAAPVAAAETSVADDGGGAPRAAGPADVQEAVKRFVDAGVPIDTRRAELAELARKGGTPAAAVLMALGNAPTYLNYAAVEALGGVKADGVAEYLQGKLSDENPRVLSAAAKSLARQQGDAVVPVLAATVRANRRRPDGFQDMVCAACVEALAETKSAKAVPVLDAELRETVGVVLGYDYGSRVVQALAALGKPEAKPVLESYADRLTETLARSSADNPMGRRYLEGKIQEARNAAAAIGK